MLIDDCTAVCRTLLPVNREVPITAALSQLIESSFPEEYQERRRESLLLPDNHEGKEAPLSVFVMSNIFPGPPPSSFLMPDVLSGFWVENPDSSRPCVRP